MSRVKFDEEGKRFYENGVDQGVLYFPVENETTGKIEYTNGVAFNGLRSVENNPEGGEITDFYADNIKYLSLTSAEKLKLTIGCYFYPDEFKECNGEKSLGTGVTVGQQTRKSFGFCYRTKIGNDLNEDLGYLLHLVYGCKTAPTSKPYNTINESPEPAEMSFEVSASSVEITKVSGMKPTYELVIDSRTVDDTKLTALENKLYGTDPEGSTTGTVPTLPTPDDVWTILNTNTTNKVFTTTTHKIEAGK